MEKDLILTPNEVKQIWDFISHQYISYENEELIKVTKRIRAYIDELAQQDSEGT